MCSQTIASDLLAPKMYWNFCVLPDVEERRKAYVYGKYLNWDKNVVIKGGFVKWSTSKVSIESLRRKKKSHVPQPKKKKLPQDNPHFFFSFHIIRF